MMPTWLWITGGLIVVVLALYAGSLLAKLHDQTRRQAAAEKQALGQRNYNLFDSIFIIAKATREAQCELSEAALRLGVLFDLVQGELRGDFAADYPHLDQLYQAVRDLPRGEARKTLDKQVRMRQDYQRLKLEAQLQDGIQQELDAILAQQNDIMAGLAAYKKP